MTGHNTQLTSSQLERAHTHCIEPCSARGVSLRDAQPQGPRSTTNLCSLVQCTQQSTTAEETSRQTPPTRRPRVSANSAPLHSRPHATLQLPLASAAARAVAAEQLAAAGAGEEALESGARRRRVERRGARAAALGRGCEVDVESQCHRPFRCAGGAAPLLAALPRRRSAPAGGKAR